jgi:class 3 adenylate cyclase
VAITESVRELGLDLRAGLHAGECEIVDGEMGGIAVQIGARVAGRARPGEVVVSGTVKDLVAGSGIAFDRPRRRGAEGHPRLVEAVRGRPGLGGVGSRP